METCRFYLNAFPQIDDVVMVEVTSINELGVYVILKEYNDIEGIILLSELSKRRIRSINKEIKIGHLEAATVMRIDKGYIDLSKRRVTEQDKEKATDKYNKSKIVHHMLNIIAQQTQMSLETIYQIIGWPLYQKYGHAYDAFRLAIENPELLGFLGLETQVQETLITCIQRKMIPTSFKLRADIECTCYTCEGIEAIKEALHAGHIISNDIKIVIISPPLYMITMTTTDKESGIQTINRAITAISEEIIKRKGVMKVKVEPRVTNDDQEEMKVGSEGTSDDDQEEMKRESGGISDD